MHAQPLPGRGHRSPRSLRVAPPLELLDRAVLVRHARVVGFLDRLVGRKSGSEPTRKLNACLVHAGGLLGIVGESYRQDELRVLSGRTTDVSRFRGDLAAYAAEVADDEPDRRWFLAILVREPDNPNDPEAVAVHAEGGGKLGYLKRDDARRYAQVFRSLEKRGYDAAACPAMLNGGGGKSFGVVLAISAPGPILNDLASMDSSEKRQ
jgi:HIRAN domain